MFEGVMWSEVVKGAARLAAARVPQVDAFSDIRCRVHAGRRSVKRSRSSTLAAGATKIPRGRISDRHRRLRAVFDEALLLKPAGRAAFVNHACANDPGLVPELMRLLAAHNDTRSFLD